MDDDLVTPPYVLINLADVEATTGYERPDEPTGADLEADLEVAQRWGSAETDGAIFDALRGHVPDSVIAAAQTAALGEGYRIAGYVEGVGMWHEPQHRPGWAEQDLLGLARIPLEPPSIAGGLFYPRQRHIVSSEPGHGKTWLGLYAAAQVVNAGGSVVWVNTDDAPEAEIVERLHLLGVDDERIRGLFHYFRPDRAAMWNGEEPEIVALAREHTPTLAVVDSFNPTIGLQGLDYMSETEVEQAWQTFARPFTDVGAAFLTLDHLTKATDSRGRYSIGSQRKLAGCSVHIGMRTLEPFGRGVTGRASLTIHKDRSGHLGPQGSLFGDFVLNAETGLLTASVEPSESAGEGGAFRPTEIMRRVSGALAEAPKGLSGRMLEREVQGKGSSVREAIAALYADGYIRREQTGRGGGFVYFHDVLFTGSTVPVEADS